MFFLFPFFIIFNHEIKYTDFHENSEHKEMKRATIITKGEVQRVGYREAVEKIARKLNISGFVEIYEEVIGKFGYIEGVSLHWGWQ